MLKSIVITLSSVFYIGYLPLPGTMGSLAGLFLFFLIKDSVFTYAAVTLSCVIFGFALSGKAEEIFQKKDAQCIVIDEVCGMLLSLIFIPYDVRLVILAFILFRILDSLKPYPAGRLQALNGGMGIMADDIVAGIYANIILQAVVRLASFKIS